MIQFYDSLISWLNTYLPGIFALGGYVIAAFSAYRNRAVTLFGHTVPAIIHLDQTWESDRMRRYRKQASIGLVRNLSDSSSKTFLLEKLEDDGLEFVMNYFETLGLLVRAGAIKPRTAWQLFGSKAFIYWESSRPWLTQLMEEDKNIYSEYQHLYKVCRIEEERAMSFYSTWPFFETLSRWVTPHSAGVKAHFVDLEIATKGGGVVKTWLSQNFYSRERLEKHIQKESEL